LEGEVAKSNQVETLFRADSITVALYSAMARLVGSEFLWNMLALPVYQLNNSAKMVCSTDWLWFDSDLLLSGMQAEKGEKEHSYQVQRRSGTSGASDINLMELGSLEVDPFRSDSGGADDAGVGVLNAIQLWLVAQKVPSFQSCSESCHTLSLGVEWYSTKQN